MNWLITGGCGFIGTNLILDLIGSGEHSIRVIDNLSVGSVQWLHQVTHVQTIDPKTIAHFPKNGHVELVIADIQDYEMAMAVSSEADVIVHLAANSGVAQSVRNPRNDCLGNVLGTLNYLEAARNRGVKRFIFASSGAPVGNCHPPIHEETPPHPVSPYGASKLSGEAYCSAYFHSFGIQTIVLRFGNAYGPFSIHKQSVIAKFIQCAMNSRQFEIYGNGQQTRDFIYVGDIIRAIQLSASVEGIGGEIFQIATNQETSINSLLQTLSHYLSKNGLPHVNTCNGEDRSWDIKRNFSDTSKAWRILGWRAETDSTKGIAKTVQWFCNA